MLKYLREQLQALLEKRDNLTGELDALLAAPTAEKRSLTADETRSFDAKRDAITALDTEIEAMEKRVADATADAERRAKADAARATAAGDATEERTNTPRAVVTREPRTYDAYQRHSYFLDLARTQLGRGDGDGGVEAARDRLQRHGRELEVELPKREARREQTAGREVRGLTGVSEQAAESAFERRVAPNRTDGQGGNFVPPLWIVDEYIDLPRFGRATANLCRNLTLPGGTDSVNLPKIATGTATGVQTADGGSVTSTDLTDTSVSAPVRTIAGQQDIAIQLLDQSPVSFDEVVFADLMADYNLRLDTQVISGTGSSGQVTGILNTSSINSVTYTDASPTLPELWVPLLQSASLIAKNRKLPGQAVVLTPSMWYWALSQLDTTNRPLIQPAPVPQSLFSTNGAADFEGPVGQFTYGLPAVVDGNIPSNLGGGTNETRIITARFSDLYLWEGAMRTRVLSEVLSGTLQVRLQVYNYVAFMANRRPEAISVISGTGVIPTSGF